MTRGGLVASKPLPGWPAMLLRRDAAAYCSLSIADFEREVNNGRLPTPVLLGKHEHWNKVQLDIALEAISGGQPEHWRDQLGLPRRVA